MTQTRLGSLIEALINVAIGFTISLGQNLFIGVLYTLISVARSYVVRRWFNAYLTRAATAAAHKFAGGGI